MIRHRIFIRPTFANKVFKRMVNTAIKLDEKEAKIQALLLRFAKHRSDSITLRITGGWVRDKLLGKTSHDLDIAIDKLTGKQFGESLNEYIRANAEELGIQAKDIHTIAANPEKSKHLETATTNLYGLDIDFVNLRSEEYAEDSRVPQIKFGTPEEDAYRRDATLNALFYNIMEQKVEDFTGKGLRDLEDGILRTPLESFNTFNDDPLRVLRLLRFASTFGFTVADEAFVAMRDNRIKHALATKISRERVGVEMDKMLSGAHPHIGLYFVADLGLEDSIFHLMEPNRPSNLQLPQSALKQNCDALLEYVEATPIEQLAPLFQGKLKPLAWTLPALSQWQGIQGVEKKKPVSAINLIIRDGLKWPKDDAKIVERAIDCESDVARATQTLDELSRKDLGLLVRQWGAHWRLAILHSIIKQRVATNSDMAQLVALYAKLANKITTMGLDDAWDLKPLAKGNDIQKRYGMKAGPWMTHATVKCIEYQLENPSATTEDCLNHLEQIKDQVLA